MVVDNDAAAAELGALKQRLSSAWSRRPTLETIHEEYYLSSNAQNLVWYTRSKSCISIPDIKSCAKSIGDIE
jgi:hypothetical protein